MAQVASRQAVLDIRGASAGSQSAFSRSGFSSSAPASVTQANVDGEGVELFLLDADPLDDEHFVLG